MSDIAVFLHVATLGRYQEVLDEALDALDRSDLALRAELVSVNVVGDGPVAIGSTIPNSTLTHLDSNVASFEIPTLASLQRYAINHPASRLLYINCLGGRYEGHGSHIRREIRQLIWYLLVERADKCLANLAGADALGIEWRKRPLPHMTTNNWWATARHIARLPDPHAYGREVAAMDLSEYGDRWRNEDMKRRHSAEFWVGSVSEMRPVSLFAMSRTGLPKEEFDAVAWWNLPGVTWQELARSRLSGRCSLGAEWRFLKVKSLFWVRFVIRWIKHRTIGRNDQADNPY